MAVCSLAGCASEPKKRISLPPNSATPQVVADTFIKAVLAGDCETVDALFPKRGTDGYTQCSDKEKYKQYTIGHVSAGVPKSYAKNPKNELRKVYITRNGQIWGFFLERSSKNDPWRITDEGVI